MASTLHDRNIISIYVINLFHALTPYFRRFLRLLALPYCYFFLINWKECTASRYQVIKDLLYIFFQLKYYPDNYSCCRLWEKSRDEWSYYYGSAYDPYQKAKLGREVQRMEYQVIFEDKEVCQKLCEGLHLPVPRCLGIIDPNEDYHTKIQQIFSESRAERIIIKPVRGSAGRGIIVADHSNGGIVIKSGTTVTSLSALVLNERSIVQDMVVQHELLSKINSSTTNTSRILTFYTRDDEVIVLGAKMRFGLTNSIVDNWSAGGIGVAVDHRNGTLFKMGFDRYGTMYTAHPNSKVISFKRNAPKSENAKKDLSA
jgi:hypothetical protein